MNTYDSLPFNERIVHMRKAVNVNANGKMRKRTRKMEALSSST